MKSTELSWQLAVGQLGSQGSKRANRALAIIPSYSNNVILPILSHRTIAPPDLLQSIIPVVNYNARSCFTRPIDIRPMVSGAQS